MKKKDEASEEFRRILLPIIRRVMPKVIAETIVGVQPMMDPKQILKAAIKDIEMEMAEKISKRQRGCS